MADIIPPAASTPAADAVSTGASGAEAAQQQASSDPVVESKAIDSVAHLGAINSILADVNDVAPPKEYSAESMKQYENAQRNIQKFRDFQSGLREVVTNPVEIAPGVVHVYTSQKEVQDFAKFVDDKLRNQLTAKDLVILHNHKQLIADAERRGERNYEKRLKAAGAGGAATSQQKTVVVVPEKEKPSGNRTPTVRELFQKQSPEAYNKFMQGNQ